MIIFLNGSINAGKSTIAAKLASALPRTISIELDALRDFARSLTLDEAIPLCLEDAAILARRWSARGFHVVLNWPISSGDLALFREALGDVDVPIRVLTLCPPLEVALSDRGGRSLNEWERARIRVHYESGIPFLADGVRIDNSSMSPNETVECIIGHLTRSENRATDVEGMRPIIHGLHHAQITIPRDVEAEARAFYVDFLGIPEVKKPETLQGRGGLWLRVGDSQVHIGTEDGVDRLTTKAHLAYMVRDLAGWRGRLAERGIPVEDGIPIPGYSRFEFRDPFGNRVEMIEHSDGAR